jgi:hypothetical protein
MESGVPRKHCARLSAGANDGGGAQEAHDEEVRHLDVLWWNSRDKFGILRTNVDVALTNPNATTARFSKSTLVLELGHDGRVGLAERPRDPLHEAGRRHH